MGVETGGRVERSMDMLEARDAREEERDIGGEVSGDMFGGSD